MFRFLNSASRIAIEAARPKRPVKLAPWSKLRLLLLLLTAYAVGIPSVANAIPVAVVAAFLAVSATSFIAIAATFVINTVIAVGLSLLTNAIFKPSAPEAAERQAAVMELSLGETSREAVVGLAGTGGSMMDCANYGGEHGTDWEVLVITLADHETTSLEGFWYNDTYRVFAGDGPHADFAGLLEVYFRRGLATDVIPAVCENIPGWSSLTHKLAGMSYVVVAYKFDQDAQASRPHLSWVLKGSPIYDPRKDSTVTGGSGLHRWDNPATWEWTDNAYLCRYQFARGFYALRQVDNYNFLTVGRGLSAIEAPPERAIAWANLCDEAVPLKGGGTEKRYRVGGVIKSTDPFLFTEDAFSAAMAGNIIQPEGGIEVEPGHAKTVAYEITDADLEELRAVQWSEFPSDRERVNTVIPRFIDPEQKWDDVSAPYRRDPADLVEDGLPNVDTLPLIFVNWHTQAQRVGEIFRRQARHEQSGTIPLPPRFSDLEEGDWIGWTSDRYFDGNRKVFKILQFNDDHYRATYSVREVASTDFTWNAATDQYDRNAAPPGSPVPGPFELADVNALPYQIVAHDGTLAPAVKVNWTTPVDPAMINVRIQVRVQGQTNFAESVRQEDAGTGIVTAGVVWGAILEVRARPVTPPAGRGYVWSPWIVVVMPAKPLIVSTDLDKTPPAVPTGLAITSTVEQQTDGSALMFLRISWSPNGEADFDHYGVRWRRAGGSWQSRQTSDLFHEIVVKAGDLYEAQVRAADVLNNWSAYSGIVSQTPSSDLNAPNTPAPFAVTARRLGNLLAWDNPGAKDLAHIEVYRALANVFPGGVPLQTIKGSKWLDSSADPGIQYWYWLKAVDWTGNKSAQTAGVSATYGKLTEIDLDSTAPAVPTGLALTSFIDTLEDGTKIVNATASWTRNVDADIDGYELGIKRGTGAWVKRWIGDDAGDVPEYTWQAKAGTAWSGRVRAVDRLGNKSAWTATVALTPPADVTAPAQPTAFTVTAKKLGNLLKWTNPADTDLSFIEIYADAANVFPGGTPLAEVKGSKFFDSEASLTATRYYWLKAVDRTGNKSAQTASANATALKIDAPELGAKSVMPTALAVGDKTNMYPDGDLKDAAFYSVSGGGSFTLPANDLAYPISENKIRVQGIVGALTTLATDWFEIFPGAGYHLRVDSKRANGAAQFDVVWQGARADGTIDEQFAVINNNDGLNFQTRSAARSAGQMPDIVKCRWLYRVYANASPSAVDFANPDQREMSRLGDSLTDSQGNLLDDDNVINQPPGVFNLNTDTNRTWNPALGPRTVDSAVLTSGKDLTLLPGVGLNLSRPGWMMRYKRTGSGPNRQIKDAAGTLLVAAAPASSYEFYYDPGTGLYKLW